MSRKKSEQSNGVVGAGGVLFPGFKVPPNDPSRDLRQKLTVTSQLSEEEMARDPDDYAGEFDEWCDTCMNTGELDCHCGGDLCICRKNGSYPCPDCG